VPRDRRAAADVSADADVWPRCRRSAAAGEDRLARSGTPRSAGPSGSTGTGHLEFREISIISSLRNYFFLLI